MHLTQKTSEEKRINYWHNHIVFKIMTGSHGPFYFPYPNKSSLLGVQCMLLELLSEQLSGDDYELCHK